MKINHGLVSHPTPLKQPEKRDTSTIVTRTLFSPFSLLFSYDNVFLHTISDECTQIVNACPIALRIARQTHAETKRGGGLLARSDPRKGVLRQGQAGVSQKDRGESSGQDHFQDLLDFQCYHRTSCETRNRSDEADSTSSYRRLDRCHRRA